MAEKQASTNKLGIKRHEDGSLLLDGQSLLASLGGVWGIAEASIPGVVYAISYTVTQNVLFSVVLATALSLVFIVGQILRKRHLAQAISGLFGIGLAAYLTLRNGVDAAHARDYYLQGFLTNIIYFAVLGLSILVRWPILGVLIGMLSSGGSWRKDIHLRRKYSLITLIWVALFGFRLLVEVPLYLANQVVALGITKLVMGIPLYALCAWFTWLAVRQSIREAK
jgi:hypothetical protein